jgi:peptidoglycan L-alanyl-D-glutamate endopeptidase CwlK
MDELMKLQDEQQIFTYHIAQLIVFATTNGFGLTFGEAYRTKYQQEEYLRTGKSKTMRSNHLKRLAVDFNFFVDGKLTYDKDALEVLGEYWELLDDKNRWGGNFTNFIDTPHFERKVI